MASEAANYTNVAAIKQHWLENIAPNYFDMNNINNYNSGIFGYINEVMATSVEDAFNATAVIRREFYPISAQYMTSLYAMATLQGIDIPLCTPATCRCALLIPQSEIIENSTFNEGIYECVIDSSLKIFAGDIQFMLDYPIKILSKKNEEWTHTCHYDINVSNSLNTSTNSRYISNKVMKADGINYLVMFIDTIRQLEMTEITKIVVKDSVMDTITIDVDFDGNLANFEIFYKETAGSSEIQLAKVLLNGTFPPVPYVQYEFITNNKIRLTFEYNSIFNPQFNSEIVCRMYTSLGSGGNFNSFSEDLVASSDSEKYPYNANMTILGRVNGSSSGGRDQYQTEEFRQSIIKAYTTNKTITTSTDLQIMFDDIARNISNVRVMFRKVRDDPMIRLFGAYAVLKDDNQNVIPTNTLNIEFLKSDFIENLQDSISRFSIFPGTIFEYKSENSYTLIPSKNSDGTLKTLENVRNEASNDKLYFTNPFLIGVNLNPNNAGYYMISIDKTMSVEYTYVNDLSVQQFIANGLRVYRNSINDSNYYTFTIKVTPAGEVDFTKIVMINDPNLAENQIIAKKNGVVTGTEYYYDNIEKRGYVRYIIKYDSESDEPEIEYIQASNTIPVGKQSVTGYAMKYSVGDTFIAGDILATKRVTDLGNMLICGDLNYQLYNNLYYFVYSVQDYDPEANVYTLEAYLSTADEIDLSQKLVITHGIYNVSGEETENVLIDMQKNVGEMNLLYNNEGNNIANKYTGFAGLNNYTLTNTYISNESDPFDLISTLSYIRSTLDFIPGGEEPDDYMITLSESPVLSALWADDGSQYEYFIQKYNSINTALGATYLMLENNFSIDSKFYNTYGKARFYTVGNNVDSMVKLDTVRCKFHFGVSLNTISSNDLFLSNFRSYVQNYIEDSSAIDVGSRDVYIMNLIATLRENFPEIAYIEYYGFNSYDYKAQKILGPDLDAYQEYYIPEFLNLDIVTDSNGQKYPNIVVDILD